VIDTDVSETATQDDQTVESGVVLSEDLIWDIQSRIDEGELAQAAELAAPLHVADQSSQSPV